jgi:uncharacterized protein (TIGR03083 family)
MHLAPIHTAHLFPVIEDQLLRLLQGLTVEDWNRPTVAKAWRVRDVVAHLVDTALRRVSVQRDGLAPPKPSMAVDTYETLVAYLNQLNAEWVTAMRRLSPEVLVQLMRVASPALCEVVKKLEPDAPALFAVSWAGESGSKNWFDVAREYTERWLHQQQIRHAVGKPGIETLELYHPVLNTWMRALPHAYRAVEASVGTVVQVDVDGPVGGSWQIIREHNDWQHNINPALPSAAVTIPAEIAWQVFSKSMPPAEAKQHISAHGKAHLWAPALHMVSVMA